MRLRNCASVLALLILASAATAQMQPRQRISFEPARVRVAPGPALRHAAVAELPALPADGITVQLACEIAWTDGQVVRCAAADASSAARAAARIAFGYNFDVSGIARTSQNAHAEMLIPIRLTEADRHATDFLARPPIDLRLIGFTRAASPGVIARYYPHAALRSEAQAAVALTCEIQPDLLVFCARPVVESEGLDTELSDRFALAALQSTSFLRAVPHLLDGSPASGVVFGYRIHFRLPDRPQP